MTDLLSRVRLHPRDLAASVVVFLVAMPLCMGIAVASGVPPEKGLLTGIVGGLVVGSLAGSPLQVSGPAAGLAVLVFELVRDRGLAALGPILVVAALIQFAAGVLRLGGWFRAISPAVVHGMLAGIGALIVLSQFHVLFDARPLASGIDNLGGMPARILGLSPTNAEATEFAFLVGVVTIAVMLGWERIRPARLKLLPGALVGVVAGTLLAGLLALPINHVTVPASMLAAVTAPDAGFLARLLDWHLWPTAFALAFIASAETLLSAAAVDRMHGGPRTDYDRELRAQGVGNLLCGLLGALPMTGVIVRSSANVQAGARSRASAILHGAWILALVVLAPGVLRLVPMAALGGILVVTGLRLISLAHVRHLWRDYGLLPALIWGATLTAVVVTDLLTGVLVGIGLSLLELLPFLFRLRLGVEQREEGGEAHVALAGAATLVTLPRLTRVLEALPAGRPLQLDLVGLSVIDHSSAEMLRDWLARTRGAGTPVLLSARPAAARHRFA